MDRNRIHLRDRSCADDTNARVVTTQQSAKVGDVLVARGAVRTDVNGDSGHSCALVLESQTLRN